MKNLLPFATLFLCLFKSHGQPRIEDTLKKLNNHSVPYITTKELKLHTHYTLLDARESKEYAVSRLAEALWIGYETFSATDIQSLIPHKNTPLVVYCSIGIRSEHIGEKLGQLGYTKVLNLYGGIFKWKNQGNPVYNSRGQETDSVHAYNRYWGRLLTHGEKVYH